MFKSSIRSGVITASVLCAFSGFAGGAQAAGEFVPETVNDATIEAFVAKASAYVGEVGEEKAFAEFTNPEGKFTKGDIYIFCHDYKAFTSLAHGGNRGLIGKNVLVFKDPTGVSVNQLIFDKVAAEGKGWVQYQWPNPLTKKVEPKMVYSTKVNDRALCGSGYYK